MKKKNILILVHIEDTYKYAYPYLFRFMYFPSIIKSCKSKKYDSIIHMTSHMEDDNPIEEIMPYVDKQIEWGYGYLPEQFINGQEEELPFVIESRGHEYTWIPPELRNGELNNYNVFIGGGCDGECLADFESILDYLDIKYKRIEGLIYG